MSDPLSVFNNNNWNDHPSGWLCDTKPHLPFCESSGHNPNPPVNQVSEPGAVGFFVAAIAFIILTSLYKKIVVKV